MPRYRARKPTSDADWIYLDARDETDARRRFPREHLRLRGQRAAGWDAVVERADEDEPADPFERDEAAALVRCVRERRTA